MRRARGVATTAVPFTIPVEDRAIRREVALELDRLVRDRVDFAVADAEALPLAAGAFSVVVLRNGDGGGRWADASAALAEAVRVLAPGGLLVTEDGLGAAPGLVAIPRDEEGLAAWRL